MPPVVREAFAQAGAARQAGQLDAAVGALEGALEQLRTEPLGVPFMARVQLALVLADTYLDAGQREQARRLLLAESGYAEQINRLIGVSGTPEQRRAASAGRMQLRDRAAQVELLDSPAPDLDVADWVLGEATTLAALRGQVVLLEFWATWCRPCLEMFPRLNDLHDQYAARGLSILALTRYGQSPPDANADAIRAARDQERALVTTVIADRGLWIRVGIAPDGRMQQRYGAAGVPTLALIDRQGIVRLIASGGDDEALERAIVACLNESGS
jgi:thiol-disulfide isomerase/thioredoxin